jgi:hypothetical protein
VDIFYTLKSEAINLDEDGLEKKNEKIVLTMWG